MSGGAPLKVRRIVGKEPCTILTLLRIFAKSQPFSVVPRSKPRGVSSSPPSPSCIVMGIVTGVAARAYHDARHRGARAQFEQGEAAANAGRTAEALEHYRAALALDRDHAEYRRALAIALISLRRTAEAETHLEQLLEFDPVDGEANLLLARIAAGRGAFTETEAFYQRAIYGRWAAGSPPRAGSPRGSS